MNTNQYDDIDVVDSGAFEPNTDLGRNMGEPPADFEVPFEVYSQEIDRLPQEDQADLSLHEALGNLTHADIEKGPPEFLDETQFPEDQSHTPVSQFIMNQISKMDAEAKQKNPNAREVNLQTAFPKNTQSQWFTEFNKQSIESNEVGKKLIAKTNGYFFTGDEDPSKALAGMGVKGELIEEFAGHFEMSYFGNTRASTKNNNTNPNGFKSYVMHLKDPTNERSLEILSEVMAAKHQVIQAKLDKSYDFNKALDVISNRAESIIKEETQKTGVPPFVGSKDRLFLSPGALYAEINEKAPELKGLYIIEPLAVKGNKVSYAGYSEGLESYFEDDLKVCKITTKDPSKLSQADLESAVIQKLDLDLTQGHVAKVPADALIQQIEILSNETPEPTTDQLAPVETKKLDGQDNSPLINEDSSKDFEENPKEQNDDESHFNRRKRKEEEAEEPDSLAKITLDALSKVTQATLAAALALVKLVFQMLMELIKAFGRLFGMNVSPSSLPDNPLLTFNNTLNRMRVYNGPASDVENTKELKPEEATADLTDALDADIANDAKLKSEYELSDVKALDKIQLSKEALENLSIEDRARLENDASTLFNGLTDEQKQEYLNKISIVTQHNISDEISSKLSEPLVYDERFGVLLATSDQVDFNGQKYGVVSAAVVGGELLYSIAKENETDNYDVQFVKADELTLLEHNAYNFDNIANLKNHINEQLAEKFAEHNGKIDKLEIVDRNDLKGHEITIAELNNRTNFIGFEQLGFDTTPISVEELIKDDMALSNELYYSLPQLHQDKTGVFDAPSKNNAHPFFGRVLDINDQVDGKLSNGDITIRGSVIGAYESDAELYYQVLHNNQFYSLKAEDISLISPNGGDLTPEQISLMKASGSEADHFRTGSIPPHHASSATVVNLLSQADDNGFNKSFQGYSHNEVVVQGGSNIGVVPLERDTDGDYIGAGKLVSITDRVGSKSHFITLGETINPKDGMKRSVAFEVDNTLIGLRVKPAGESRLVQLNLDDPALKVVTAGLKNEDLKVFARKARKIYENGSMRRVANVVAHYANEAKSRILGENNEPLAMAQESYLQNKVALSLLQEKAGLAPKVPLMDMGLSANLATSKLSVDQVQKIIDQPDSRNHVKSQDVVYTNPSDLVSYSLGLTKNPVLDTLSVNDLILNYSTQPKDLAEQLIAPAMDSLDAKVPVVEPPTTEALSAEVPVAENLIVETPTAEPLVAEVPVVEAPITNTHIAETLSVDVPIVETPTTNTPAAEALGSEAPVVEHRTTELPDIDAPDFQGVNFDQLNLVRVQRGLDDIEVRDGNVVLKHNIDHENSVRNTMHFSLNGHVNDHAYGKFNDAKYAIIAPLAGVAANNTIGGFGAADTWFHAKDGEIVVPQPTLIMPSSAEIPDIFDNTDIQVAVYFEGSTPEETLANRNAMIATALSDRGSPQFDINMHNWNGRSYSAEDQLAVSKFLGSEAVLPNNHAQSIDGQLENSFSYLDSLVERRNNGEIEFLNTNNGQWLQVEDGIASVTSNIHEAINSIKDESVRQHYLDAFEKRSNAEHLVVEKNLEATSKPLESLVQREIEDTNPILPEPEVIEELAAHQGPVLSSEITSIENNDAQKLATIASAYVSGQPVGIADNQKVLNILSEKQRLAENFDLLTEQAEKFDVVLRSVGLVSFDNLNSSDIGFLKDALSNDGITLHLNNLRDSVDDFSLDYAEHIDALNGYLTNVGQDINFETLNEDSVNTLNSLNESLKADLIEKANGADQVQGLVKKMDLIQQNTPDAIQALLPEIDKDGASSFSKQMEKLDSVFANQIPQYSKENAQILEANLGPSF